MKTLKEDSYKSQMTPYTMNEVFRTAQPYMHTEPNSLGAGLEHGINEVCVCCKSQAKPLSSAELQEPFKRFYKTFEYKAYQCPACWYMFSWYRNKK